VRSLSIRWGWSFFSLILLASGTVQAQKIRPGEYFMPSTSQGFIAVTQVETLVEHYDRTELGKLTSDPAMEPFTKDLKRQFENKWSGVHERLGLTLKDLRDIAGGEVSVAMIKPDEDLLKDNKNSGGGDPNTSAMALVVDVTGKLDVTRKKIEELKKFFAEEKATEENIKVEETSEPVLQFTLPIPEEEKEAAASEFGDAQPGTEEKAAPSPPKPTAPKPRKTFYFLVGNLFGAADDLDIVRGVLARIGGRKGDALADVVGFQNVMQRCRADFDGTPQIRWFMYPVGYASAARAATPEAKRRQGKTILEVLRNQGFTGIKGMGGYAGFSTEGFDLIHRTAVYAPKPYQGSMKMLEFFNREDYAPQPWVPRDIATYTTFYFDVLNAFDNFGPLFDEMSGGGSPGLWKKTLINFRDDPNGPQIDLRAELIKLLNQRVTIVTDYQTPIGLNSERILVALEVSDEEAAARGLDKAMRGDRGAKLHEEFPGVKIWEIVEEKTKLPPPIEIDLGDSGSSAAPAPAGNEPPKNDENPRVFPHAALAVTQGHLFIASHLDFLVKILQHREPRELLCNDLDYRTVEQEIARVPPEKTCLHFYSRTDEEYRPTYELVRQNKMPESENMLARLLNSLFAEGKKKTLREPKLDGRKLPPYDVVRHYLRPAGMQVTSEENGWFLKGFTLPKPEGGVEEAKTAAVEKRGSEAKPAAAVTPAVPEKTAGEGPAADKPAEPKSSGK
jgi:hypothetical protein